MHARLAIAALAAIGLVTGVTLGARGDRNLDVANPLRPLPAPPVGLNGLDDLPSPPVPERVRLGRWLFYDKRLSADGTVSCGTCHVPDRAFSNATRVASGTGGHLGHRKTPSFINAAHAFGPRRFGWDAVSARYTDEGRATITGRPGDRGAFKTPTLRDVARHPPYMHDGSLQTLRDVIRFYGRGGIRNPHLDIQIRPFDISPGDVDALVDFLSALNGEGFKDRAPTVFPK